MVAFLGPEGADLSGECNSYGYRVVARFNRDGLVFQMLFEKYQTTQNAVIIPKDANVYMGTKVIISGMQNRYSVNIGKSRLWRLFMPKKYKALLPSPFYIFCNHPSQHAVQENLIPFIHRQSINEFRLSDREALCRVHQQVKNPLALLEDIEKVIRGIG